MFTAVCLRRLSYFVLTVFAVQLIPARANGDTPLIVFDKKLGIYREGVLRYVDETLEGVSCLSCVGALACAVIALGTALVPEDRGWSALFGTGAFVFGIGFRRMGQSSGRPHIFLPADPAKKIKSRKILLGQKELPLLSTLLSKQNDEPIPGLDLSGRWAVAFPRDFTPPDDRALFRLEKYAFDVTGEGENLTPVDDQFLGQFPVYQFDFDGLRSSLTDEASWPVVLQRLGYLDDKKFRTVRYLQGRVHSPSGLRSGPDTQWGFYGDSFSTHKERIYVLFTPFDLSYPTVGESSAKGRKTALRAQRALHADEVTQLFPPDSVERDRLIENLGAALTQDPEPKTKKRIIGELLVLLAFTTENSQRVRISRALSGHLNLTSAHFVLHHGLRAISETVARQEIADVLTKYSRDTRDNSILSRGLISETATGDNASNPGEIYISAGSCSADFVTSYDGKISSVSRSKMTSLFSPQTPD